MFFDEVEGGVRSWKGVFYFLSNKSEEGIVMSQSEWAHCLLSVAWTDVSSSIHMAGGKRRKKALLLTLLEVYVEQRLLGWFWQWQVDYADSSLFAWGSRETFLWRSSRGDKFTIVLLWEDCTGGSPLNCATSRLPDQQTKVTSKNVFPLKYTPRFYSSRQWECVLNADEKQMQWVTYSGTCVLLGRHIFSYTAKVT